MLASSRFVRAQLVQHRSVPEGAVLVNLETGRCFQLNRLGAQIWESLEGGGSLDEVLESICSRFRMPREAIAGDVQCFLERLREEGLVTEPPAARTRPAENLDSLISGFGDRFALAITPDGGVAVDLHTGAYYRLDTLAARVCEALANSHSLSGAAERLTEQKVVDQVRAGEAVRAVLQGLTSADAAAAAIPAEPFTFKPWPGGHALDDGTGPVLWVDAGGSELKLLRELRSLRFPLEFYLRVVSPRIIFLRGGTVLHASACTIEGRLIAFCGRSGAGKTTTARALGRHGASLISEDLLVLSLSEGAVSARPQGEGIILRWASLLAETLRQNPDRAAPCGEIDVVHKGPTAPIDQLCFIDPARRRGADIKTVALTPTECLYEVIPSNFLGSADSRHWRRFLDSSLMVARAVSAAMVWMPDGIPALEQAAARYITNSAA
jgi:hypothetical protein